LRLLKSGAASPAASVSELAASAGAHVLIAVPHAATRDCLRQHLMAQGFQTVTVASASEVDGVLSAAHDAAAPIQVLLLYQTWILNEPRVEPKRLATSPAVIALTSVSHHINPAESAAAGFSGTLVKPVRVDELTRTLQKALLGQRSGAESSASLAPSKPVPKGRSLRVLVAEDNRLNQRLAQRLLERLGHVPIVVGNGHEAVERVEREPFDVVLMDCQMPGLDGFEAARRLRRRQQEQTSRLYGKPLHIIAFTANAMPGDREKCLQAGMDGYVSKPVVFEELKAVLDRLSGPAAEAA
jgi:two-component system sensor histidine kinase/response regulator